MGEDFFSAMKEVLASALLPESDRHGVTRLIVKVDGTPKADLLICCFLSAGLTCTKNSVGPKTRKSCKQTNNQTEVMNCCGSPPMSLYC